jgi:UDPglucose--hexose-1-phosphate uridylyltransferase
VVSGPEDHSTYSSLTYSSRTFAAMSEFRQDPMSRRWVIIGGERNGRPNEFVEAATRASGISCPFCAGHESETPPAIASYSANGKGQWLARIVPNKYPALSAAANGNGKGHADSLPGFGSHEVIIESPRHVPSLSDLTDAEATAVFTAYRDRLAQLKSQRLYRYVQIFKNVGPAAGASLEHVHSQLLALTSVPEALQQELVASGDYFSEHKRSLLLDLLENELAADQRIVATTTNFVAFCPYASRFGYETWVVPRRHQPRFEDVEAGELGELSLLVRDVISRIERTAGQVPYNYFLHTQPFDMPAYDHYHWHIEIIPRLTKVAGFEWSTGCFINPYSPESAAQHLRSVV